MPKAISQRKLVFRYLQHKLVLSLVIYNIPTTINLDRNMQPRNEVEPLPIQLHTQILREGKAIQPYMRKEGNYSVVFYAKDENFQEFTKLGHVSYWLMEDLLASGPYIYVEHIQSYVRGYIKNVGTALHEFAFRESVRLGGYGKVKLSVNEQSHYFHYQCGFSPCSYSDVYSVAEQHQDTLNILFDKYLSEKSSTSKNAIDEYVTKHQINIDDLKSFARKTLGKDNQEEVSYDEMVEYGLYREKDRREEIGKIFAEIKEKYPTQRVVLPNTVRVSDMHLTIAEINKKLKLFKLTMNEPNIHKRRDIYLYLFGIKQQLNSEVKTTETDNFFASYRPKS
jgi:hypothetical protein